MTPVSQPPIRAVPTESVTYGFTHWPVRQANHETSGGGACSYKRFATQRGCNCSEHKRSRDASGDGTHLAPRRHRAVKLSGVWLPHAGPRCLLSAVGKQQVCCRFGAFSPMGHASLGRCENQPKRPHVVFARLGSRHVPSSRASPNTLRQQSVGQRHTLTPSHCRVVPQLVNSYASGFQESFRDCASTWRGFVLWQLRQLMIEMEFNSLHQVETQS